MLSVRSFSGWTLGALLVFGCWCLYVAVGSPIEKQRAGEGDGALYRAVLGRVSGGESYYAAAHAEMVGRHYGVQSVFNWRVPTLIVLASVSPVAAKWTLVAGGLVALLLAVRMAEGRLSRVILALALAGALMLSVFDEGYLFSELWAGVFIFLSVLLYPKRPVVSVGAALAALFLRELAGVYVGILFCWMLVSRDWRPLCVCLIGLLGYGTYFLYHIHEVHAHLLPSDPAYPTGWVQFGGVRFVLATVRQNVWLLLLPGWVTAIYLPAAMWGLVRMPHPLARVTGLAYLGVFGVIGKPFNDYWGVLISPLLAYGFAYAVRYPFTAPPARPETNSFCREKKSAMTGSKLSTVPAMSTPY